MCKTKVAKRKRGEKGRVKVATNRFERVARVVQLKESELKDKTAAAASGTKTRSVSRSGLPCDGDHHHHRHHDHNDDELVVKVTFFGGHVWHVSGHESSDDTNVPSDRSVSTPTCGSFCEWCGDCRPLEFRMQVIVDISFALPLVKAGNGSLSSIRVQV